MRNVQKASRKWNDFPPRLSPFFQCMPSISAGNNIHKACKEAFEGDSKSRYDAKRRKEAITKNTSQSESQHVEHAATPKVGKM